jgi:hypothetical protein
VSSRKRLRAVVATVVLIQVAVPLWVLAQPQRPARFGWQMYAGVVTPLEITVVTRDGTRRAIAPHEVLGRRRPELSYGARLTRHLCRRYPAARVVTVRQTEPRVRADRRCPST